MIVTFVYPSIHGGQPTRAQETIDKVDDVVVELVSFDDSEDAADFATKKHPFEFIPALDGADIPVRVHCVDVVCGGNPMRYIAGTDVFVMNDDGVTIQKHMLRDSKLESYSDQGILEDVLEFYVECLEDDVTGSAAREYLASNAITERAGYAPAAWCALKNRFGEKYGVKKLRSLGLLTQGAKGYYDFFRDRIITTVRNDNGEIVCFEGEALRTNVPESIKTITSPPNRYTVLQSAT